MQSIVLIAGLLSSVYIMTHLGIIVKGNGFCVFCDSCVVFGRGMLAHSVVYVYNALYNEGNVALTRGIWAFC